MVIGARRLLLVEDDEKLGEQLRLRLEEAGFSVLLETRGDDALHAAIDGVELAILDLNLPGAGGVEVLRALRLRSDVPVLVLTARRDPRDVVACLSQGADDFVTKPFSADELLARIDARLRRPALQRVDALGRVLADDDGRLVVDGARRGASVDGADCPLTKVEFDVLFTLVRRPGAAVTRRSLVDAVLDLDRDGTERTLDVHVSRLRKKLGPLGAHVETVRGIGYRFRPGPPRAASGARKVEEPG